MNQSKKVTSDVHVLYKDEAGTGTSAEKGIVQAQYQLTAKAFAQSELQSPLNIFKHNKHFKLNKLSLSLSRCQEREKEEVENKEAGEKKRIGGRALEIIRFRFGNPFEVYL